MLETFELYLLSVLYCGQMLYPRIGARADQDLPANCIGFDAICLIDGATHSTVFGAFFRADVADNGLASVNTNPHVQLWQPTLPLFGIDLNQDILHGHGTGHGTLL